MRSLITLISASIMAVTPALANSYNTAIEFEDPGAFNYNGADINTDRSNFNVCLPDTNICFMPKQANIAQYPNCEFRMMETRLLKAIPEGDFIVSEYDDLNNVRGSLQAMTETGHRYPAVHYEICQQTGTHTVGAFCAGDEGPGQIFMCSFIREERASRSAYK